MPKRPTNSAGLMAATFSSKRTTRTSYAPACLSRSIRAGRSLSRRGARPGASTDSGCGQKVITASSPSPRSAWRTLRCPRCTPSKLPMATTLVPLFTIERLATGHAACIRLPARRRQPGKQKASCLAPVLAPGSCGVLAVSPPQGSRTASGAHGPLPRARARCRWWRNRH